MILEGIRPVGGRICFVLELRAFESTSRSPLVTSPTLGDTFFLDGALLMGVGRRALPVDNLLS